MLANSQIVSSNLPCQRMLSNDWSNKILKLVNNGSRVWPGIKIQVIFIIKGKVYESL